MTSFAGLRPPLPRLSAAKATTPTEKQKLGCPRRALPPDARVREQAAVHRVSQARSAREANLARTVLGGDIARTLAPRATK
jgi:hypothetical protein